MVASNRTETPVGLILGNCLAEVDGVVASLSGAAALLYSTEETARVDEVVRAARVVRDQIIRLVQIRGRLDAAELRVAQEEFDLPIASEIEGYSAAR